MHRRLSSAEIFLPFAPPRSIPLFFKGEKCGGFFQRLILQFQFALQFLDPLPEQRVLIFVFDLVHFPISAHETHYLILPLAKMAMVETLRPEIEAELFLGHETRFEERLGFGGEAPVLGSGRLHLEAVRIG